MIPALPNRLGATVCRGVPKGAPTAKSEIGTVIEVRALEPVNHGEWGRYWYFAELIQFPACREIRLAYYYLPPGEPKHWIFGGQYSVMDYPHVIKDLCRTALELG
jgi:hypothetical protein